MPSVSQKQHNFMEMIAHGGKPRSGRGPSKAVAQEFVQADANPGLLSSAMTRKPKRAPKQR